MSIVQQHLPEDYPLWLYYAQSIRLDLGSGSGYLKRIVFSDERIFNTSGVFNKHFAEVWV